MPNDFHRFRLEYEDEGTWRTRHAHAIQFILLLAILFFIRSYIRCYVQTLCVCVSSSAASESSVFFFFLVRLIWTLRSKCSITYSIFQLESLQGFVLCHGIDFDVATVHFHGECAPPFVYVNMRPVQRLWLVENATEQASLGLPSIC